jgi:phage host-nuclease inhibitor protein Gam
MEFVPPNNKFQITQEEVEELQELNALRMEEYRDATGLEEQEDDDPSWEQETEFLEWYLKHMSALEAEEKLIIDQYMEMMKGITDSRQEILQLHGAEFERISLQRIEAQKSGKLIRLFHGTVQARSYGPSMRVTDPEAAIQWAIRFKPEVTRTKISVNFMDYVRVAKEMTAETGELPPGVTITEPKTVLYYPGKPKE